MRRVILVLLLVWGCSRKGVIPFEMGPVEERPTGVSEAPPGEPASTVATPAAGEPRAPIPTPAPRAIPAGAAGEPGTLRTAAAEKGLLVGAAVAWHPLHHDASYADLLSKHFSYVTPENAMKWGHVRPAPDAHDYGAADDIVARALANGQKVKGHTLVWHDAQPAWITEHTPPEEFRRALEEHVRAMVKRYRGNVIAWDVVNEAMWEDGTLRKSILLEKLGPDFVAEAFRWANEEDPDAKLHINDFSVLWLNPKSDGLYELCKDLVQAGVPIDGVGFQSHLTAASPPHINKIRQNFARFAELGLELHVSELDVRIGGMKGTSETIFTQQRKVFMSVFGACVMEPACKAVTTWGVNDTYTWVDTYYGTTDAPLLFDREYQPKAALSGALAGLESLKLTH